MLAAYSALVRERRRLELGRNLGPRGPMSISATRFSRSACARSRSAANRSTTHEGDPLRADPIGMPIRIWNTRLPAGVHKSNGVSAEESWANNVMELQ